MQKPAFIFDFGNVLVRWDPHALYAPFFDGNRAAIDSFLEEIDFVAWNIQQDKGRSFADGVAELSARFPQYAHLIRAYHTHWEDCITGQINGTVEIMERLKSAGYPLYGLTNFSAETFPIMRERYDFLTRFDDIIVSGEVGLVKPDPVIYKLTLNRIGLPEADCVFIDDSLTNIKSAQEMGFSVIHFTTPEKLQSALDDLQIIY